MRVVDAVPVLTLARRYVREGDARASWRGAQGARAMLEQCVLPAVGDGGALAWLQALPLLVQGERKTRAKKK